MAEPVRARRLTDQEGQRLQQIVRRGKHGSVRVRRANGITEGPTGGWCRWGSGSGEANVTCHGDWHACHGSWHACHGD